MLLPISILTYTVIICSTYIGGLICGISGFGVGIIFQAIWNLVNNNIDLHLNDSDNTITPLQTSLSIVACVTPINSGRILYDIYSKNNHHNIKYNIVISSLITTLPMTVVGTYLVTHINNNILKRVLGITFWLFALYQITNQLYIYYINNTTTTDNNNNNNTNIINTSSSADSLNGYNNNDINTTIQYKPISTNEHNINNSIHIATIQQQSVKSIDDTTHLTSKYDIFKYYLFHKHTYMSMLFGSVGGILSGAFGTGGYVIWLLTNQLLIRMT